MLAGCMLITLQNNSDRVKIACLAQLVNVIAPIMTENGGVAWKQTIFYPYMYASLFGNGVALSTKAEVDAYTSVEGWDVPYLCSSTIFDEENGRLVIFAVNRSLEDKIELDVSLKGLEGYALAEHIELYCDDLKATNSKKEQRVAPHKKEISCGSSISLEKHSWNMLVFERNS